MQHVTTKPIPLNQRHRWTAEMIHPIADGGQGQPASFVTKTFSLASVTGSEALYISALGLYRAFINGKRVGSDLLTPGWTVYDKRLSYQTYAVAELLLDGENTIDIWLADGWLRSPLLWLPDQVANVWGDQLAAIAEIHRDASGSPILRTDATWRSGELHIRRSGIYYGEDVDRRVGVVASAGVTPLSFNPHILVPHEAAPVREMAAFAPVASWQDDEGRWIYDFGQNLAGYVAYTVAGEAGATVTVEHAEVLEKGKKFYNGNLRSAQSRTRYTLQGGSAEHYRPTFTFHGYRYARVTIEGHAALRDVVSVPISSLPDQKAGFTCAQPLVNRLVLNTVWSQRSNFIEVPTDCPQRDERLGWTGDAQVFAGTACYLADAEAFLAKWLRDVMADQRESGAIPHFSPDPTRHFAHLDGAYGSTGWGDAIVIVPWQLYLHYGDRSILRETLPAMLRWIDFVWSISDGPLVSPPRQGGKRGFTFGDWLQPGGPSTKPLPTIGDEAAATIYLFISTSLVARMASVLGETEIAKDMTDRSEQVRAVFQREFITASGRLAYDDQTSYALAFVHDLIPEELRPAAAAYFKATVARANGRIGTGFIGTPALLPALTKLGEADLVESLFLQEDVPGWLYQVRMGATTVWERWDSIRADGTIYDPEMNSYNHYSYGSVCQWLFESVAGFAPDASDPGFGTIIFAPTILPKLAPVAAWHDSHRGRIAAAWSLDGTIVTYAIEVPEGCRGILRLPTDARDATIDGAMFADAAVSPGRHEVTFVLPSLGQ